MYKELGEYLGAIFHELARQKECQIEEGHLCSDHVHMLISIPPKYLVSHTIWIYGAIAPLSGNHFLHEFPKLNGECFQEFLDWLSQELGEDWAILQMDQAPAHMSSTIRWPENIIPLVQPAHSPELNPIERFWQLLKRPLKNLIFSTLQALRERVQQLFDQLTLEEVMLVSSYNFILEALFYVASH